MYPTTGQGQAFYQGQGQTQTYFLFIYFYLSTGVIQRRTYKDKAEVRIIL